MAKGYRYLNPSLALTAPIRVTITSKIRKPMTMGIPIVIGLVIFCLIITIIAAISANDGKSYRYPLNLRLIK